MSEKTRELLSEVIVRATKQGLMVVLEHSECHDLQGVVSINVDMLDEKIVEDYLLELDAYPSVVTLPASV